MFMNVELMVDEKLIRGDVRTPEGDGPFPTVCFYHGFCVDRIGLMRLHELFARKCVENGIACVKFDFYGCGDSDGDFSEMRYLDEIEQGIKRYEMENKTGNSVLDTILSSKSEICLKQGISMTVVADGKLLNHIHVMDLCTIMGNALDNAIEYELQVENLEERLIRVNVYEKNSFVCIVIENYYIGNLVFQEGLPITTKGNTQYHGYGLKSIRYSVEKYDGYINVGVKDNWFRLEMLLPLKKQEE